MLRSILLALLLTVLSGCESVKLAETGIYSGQTYGHTGIEYQATPIRTQTLFENNRIGDFRFLVGPELITDLIVKPKSGYFVGLAPIAKITYTWDPFRVFVEAGAGPSYLTIRTKEQGGPGFNFVDQVGVGMECNILDRLSLVGKYRYSHTSHAGVRDSSNNGIDAHSGQFGLKLDF